MFAPVRSTTPPGPGCPFESMTSAAFFFASTTGEQQQQSSTSTSASSIDVLVLEREQLHCFSCSLLVRLDRIAGCIVCFLGFGADARGKREHTK